MSDEDVSGPSWSMVSNENPFLRADSSLRTDKAHSALPSRPRSTSNEPTGPSRIEHLPAHSSRLIASTLRIPSIAAVFESLLWNSLQGGASKVDAWLEVDGDAKAGGVSDLTLEVQDDGSGIDRGAMDEVGEWQDAQKEDLDGSARNTDAGAEMVGGDPVAAGHVSSGHCRCESRHGTWNARPAACRETGAISHAIDTGSPGSHSSSVIARSHIPPLPSLRPYWPACTPYGPVVSQLSFG